MSDHPSLALMVMSPLIISSDSLGFPGERHHKNEKARRDGIAGQRRTGPYGNGTSVLQYYRNRMPYFNAELVRPCMDSFLDSQLYG